MTEQQMIRELNKVEDDTRKGTIEDILIDLADWAKDSDPTEKPGLELAIQIIKSNYGG